MRSKIVAGNWKMNLTFDEAQALVDDILDRLDEQDELNCEVIICPPYPYLELLTDFEFDEQRFNVGAQNCSALTWVPRIAAPTTRAPIRARCQLKC